MITKAEAVENVTKKESAEYALWEKKIDEALSTHSGRTIVDVPNLSMRVRERLMRAYRGAGWTVDFRDSQFDGASLSFT